MKFWQTVPFAMAALVIQAQAVPDARTVPLYVVTVVQNSAKAINYGQMKGSTKIDFQGTVLLPKASGMAKVKVETGGTFIKAEFKNMAPASSFGGEYLTYVLWGISTEGRATNLGEIVLNKHGKGELKVTDALQTFGLVVTAEPYFAVSQPSDVVVLENVARKSSQEQVEYIDAKFSLLKRGQYRPEPGFRRAQRHGRQDALRRLPGPQCRAHRARGWWHGLCSHRHGQG